MFSNLSLEDIEMKKLLLCCVTMGGFFLSAYFIVPQFALSGGDDAKELA